MCGIFGLVSSSEGRAIDVAPLLSSLFRLSESRGKEAAGLAGISGDHIRVLKSPVASSDLMRTKTYANYFRDVVVEPQKELGRVAIVGHSRLVTNGSQTEHRNNQPVCVDGIAGVHNGIIVNDGVLWNQHPELTRESDVDTEILFRLIRRYCREGSSIINGLRRAYADVSGVANIAFFSEELNQLVLATNNGSLYYVSDPRLRLFAFASEEYILRQALRRAGLGRTAPVEQLPANRGLLVHLHDVITQPFSLSLSETSDVIEQNGVHRAILEEDIEPKLRKARARQARGTGVPPVWFIEEYEKNREAISNLRRCKRCVQPETVPFVDLDEQGICVDCRHAKPLTFHGHEALEKVLEPHRSKDGRPDVLVPLSGGRDSCYSLHYIKTVLKMNPIAYTYDWGMVTDLARRNCSRMCSQLGVEHIIVSADIWKKREYIRKNVEAWLKKPDLGIIPLFMAGDKQFFYFSEQLQKRTGIRYQIWGNNRLERTDFKTGFCGFDRAGYRDHTLFRMDALNSLRLALYYLKAYAKNPAYLNRSIPDTLFSYFIYYVKELDYLDFYDYIEWNEETVVRTLIEKYDWETSPDTTTTWRIGDGTAAFYNYIYWTVAGFSESDTFRSGQVRVGSMTREQALAVIAEENRPRFDSLTWYCQTVGLDLDRTLEIINAIPKLYPSQSK